MVKTFATRYRLRIRQMRLLDAIDCFSNFNSHLENALLWLVTIGNNLKDFYASVKMNSRNPIMIKYQEEHYQVMPAVVKSCVFIALLKIL